MPSICCFYTSWFDHIYHSAMPFIPNPLCSYNYDILDLVAMDRYSTCGPGYSRFYTALAINHYCYSWWKFSLVGTVQLRCHGISLGYSGQRWSAHTRILCPHATLARPPSTPCSLFPPSLRAPPGTPLERGQRSGCPGGNKLKVGRGERHGVPKGKPQRP